MRDLRLQVANVAGVELLRARAVHQPRHVRALAGPAGGRRLVVHPLRLRHVLDRMDVSAGLAIFLGEAVAGEEDHVGRRGFEIIARRGPAVLGPRRSNRPSACRLRIRGDSSRPTCCYRFPTAPMGRSGSRWRASSRRWRIEAASSPSRNVTAAAASNKAQPRHAGGGDELRVICVHREFPLSCRSYGRPADCRRWIGWEHRRQLRPENARAWPKGCGPSREAPRDGSPSSASRRRLMRPPGPRPRRPRHGSGGSCLPPPARRRPRAG